ncbi:hypothetical protein HPB49_010597 [Dermacentor silvarum]|uniref:Uncharacterized protein n=1 Tax=Dermacentor silvarum TaxID=543639 RepID=A0ACB8CWU8_DERSI|nr:hypothetical protein HPB49_010597 [Dermacentor silvarum]
MPCKCCVPRCRGNYTGDMKVHVFKFPRDQALRDAWIRAVPRENLTVTEHSRVCELHFMDEDIIRDATHTDQATGRVMTVPLSHVRLRPDAVPSKFPNHSSYLSRKTARREDPDSKRARIENAALQKAIAESNEAFIRARKEDKVNSVSELANHLRSQGMKFWDVIERNERLLLIHIVDDEAPWLKYSVCVKGDLSVTLHVMKTAVKKLGANLCVPEIANSKREALRALGAKHNLFSFEATATFVEIILKWWKIVNVKTPWKGERLRDHFQQPVLSIDNDPKIDFLHMFLKWLDEWKNKGFDNGTLTKETHAALEHTTYALVELARYSFEELGMSYVLFGKIQTDCLEDRFGKYRQLEGAQYHISIRQIYEVENKLRLQSTLPTVSPDQHWECVRKQVEALLPSSNVVVTSQALTKMQDVVPFLVYVAGYGVYGTLKKLKCEQCRDSLTVDKKITVSATNEHYGLVKQLDRGGLVYTSMFALNAVAHSYVVVEQLATEPALLMMPEQRQVITKMTLQLLASEEQSDFDTCGSATHFVTAPLTSKTISPLLKGKQRVRSLVVLAARFHPPPPTSPGRTITPKSRTLVHCDVERSFRSYYNVCILVPRD